MTLYKEKSAGAWSSRICFFVPSNRQEGSKQEFSRLPNECHPERSEGSRINQRYEILRRFTPQDDTANRALNRNLADDLLALHRTRRAAACCRRRRRHSRTVPRHSTTPDCSVRQRRTTDRPGIDPYALHQRCVIARLHSSRGNLSLASFASACFLVKCLHFFAVGATLAVARHGATHCVMPLRGWDVEDAIHTTHQEVRRKITVR